jgi:hypothetical protein
MDAMMMDGWVLYGKMEMHGDEIDYVRAAKIESWIGGVETTGYRQRRNRDICKWMSVSDSLTRSAGKGRAGASR